MKTKELINLVLIVGTALIVNQGLNAQAFTKVDETSHDIAYYRQSMATPPLVKVIYGRPKKQNDQVFGNSVAYNKIWRTGANEATEIKFYNDILFGDVKVEAGNYVLYTIPGENEWEIILSSEVDVLGAYQYNPLFNVAKITVKTTVGEELEYFSIGFKEKGELVQMVLAWDTTRVKIPLEFSYKENIAKL